MEDERRRTRSGGVKREHDEGGRGGAGGHGRVRGWVGDWHLISGRMTAAASGSIRRPRGQCAGGSDPLSTSPASLPPPPPPPPPLLSTYRPLCSEPEYTGQNRTRLLRLSGETLLLSTHRRVERNRSEGKRKGGKGTEEREGCARESFLPLPQPNLLTEHHVRRISGSTSAK